VSARIALATCAELPELGEDEPLLLHALRARGVAAEPAVWDYPAIDWEAYELVVGEYVIKPTISAGSRDTARYLLAEHVLERL